MSIQSSACNRHAWIDGSIEPLNLASNCEETRDSSILAQIRSAFGQLPDQAGILHGLRRVKRGARGRRTSMFTSAKSGGSFVLESGPELAHALNLERDPCVLAFRTQALRIEVPGHGVAYPDFLVQYANHFEVHEVKASEASIGKGQVQRYRALEAELVSKGIHFKIVSADVLPQGRAFEQLCIGYTRAHSLPIDDLLIQRAHQILRLRKPDALSQAYELIAESGVPVSTVDYLLFHGCIEFSSHTLPKEEAN